MGDLTLLIDLDDTLYPADSGVWQYIRDRIDLYMITVLGIPRAEVPALRQHLFQCFGTTLRGLEATMHIDTAEYLRFVHDVPLGNYLKPDTHLKQVLDRYQMPKFIFTNGDEPHARRVLNVLGLSDCFDGIIDIRMLTPFCKPMPEAFDFALQHIRQTRADRCVMIDDSPRNLAAAHHRGLQTVLVGQPDSSVAFAKVISRLADLPNVLSANGHHSFKEEQ